MDEFSLISDHSVLLQGRGMFSAEAEAGAFSADRYVGLSNSSSGGYTVRTQDEHCDWPELDDFNDFETNFRNFDPTYEIGINYFDDKLWSSVCSPEALLVPSSYFDNLNFSIDQNESKADPMLQSSVSVPDATGAKQSFVDQINMKNPTNTQQQSRDEGRYHTPLNGEAHASSSSSEIGQFSQNSDAGLFCPFDDIASGKQFGGFDGLEAILCSNQEMRVPMASSTMRNDGTVPSSTCSGPDLVAAHIPRSTKKRHDQLHETPDMILEGMAENPLEMYFPPLTTYEQPEVLMSDTSTQTYPFPGSGVQNCAGSQFCSKEMTSAELHDQQPRSAMILEAVPVKDLGFQKLQEGMNQLGLATRGRIRDALYRLANGVEQRHSVASTIGVGSSGSKRFKSSRWTKTQTNPMDQSVAQLLLQKPSYQRTALPHRVT